MTWTLTRTRRLLCPPDQAWELVSDLALTPTLNPMIRSVETSGPDEGLGARRRCRAAGPGHIDEEVVSWVPGQHVTLRIVGGMPIRAEGTWTVSEADIGTEVRFDYVPLPHLGPVGSTMHRLMRRQLARNFDAMLDALVDHVEVLR